MRCNICDTEFTVKPSRLKQNKSGKFACSAPCLAELRRAMQVDRWGSDLSRSATCKACGKAFVRKPSQLEKYASNFCSRECRAATIKMPHREKTGRWIPCETCGTEVWRTPATLRPHTFCSRSCAGSNPRTPRAERIVKPCGSCGKPMEKLPSESFRQFCSNSCAAAAVQGAKRGLPGRAWPQEQRDRLAATLKGKYQGDWASRRIELSQSMAGPGNPRWKDGSATRPYAPGFTDQLKRHIAERDGFKCKRCQAPQEPGTHVVHHMDGEKHNHDESNLVLLCRPCHGNVHSLMEKGLL